MISKVRIIQNIDVKINAMFIYRLYRIIIVVYIINPATFCMHLCSNSFDDMDTGDVTRMSSLSIYLSTVKNT
jgi:hypothetical protein